MMNLAKVSGQNVYDGSNVREVDTVNTAGKGKHFIYTAPHSGLIVPQVANNYIDVNNPKVREEMYTDGDPWTNLLDFTGLGGQGAHPSIHRDSGDINRFSSHQDFLRTKSFDGYELMKQGYDPAVVEVLKQYHSFFWDALNQKIDETNPKMVMHVHSMEPTSPSSYDQGNLKRPDILLVAGEPGKFMRPEFYDGVVQALEDKLGNYDVEINGPLASSIKNYHFFHETAKKKDSMMLEINKNHLMNGREFSPEKTAKLQDDLSAVVDHILSNPRL